MGKISRKMSTCALLELPVISSRDNSLEGPVAVQYVQTMQLTVPHDVNNESKSSRKLRHKIGVPKPILVQSDAFNLVLGAGCADIEIRDNGLRPQNPTFPCERRYLCDKWVAQITALRHKQPHGEADDRPRRRCKRASPTRSNTNFGLETSRHQTRDLRQPCNHPQDHRH